MKVVFMGTPSFALSALEALISSKHEVAAVYTKPPKQAGRGQQISKTPIHKFAEHHNLHIETPESLRKKEAQEQLRSFNADIIIVVAYGLILPKEVLEMCKYGCINIHPSLLPKWRGADPIRQSILAGDDEIGVTIMRVGEGIDDGDILKQEIIQLNKNAKYKEVHDILERMGATLLLNTLEDFQNENIKSTPQDHSKATYTKKLETEDGKINWNKTADEIYRQILALSDSLGVFFTFNGEKIKVFDAEVRNTEDCNNLNSFVIGIVLTKDLCILCGNNTVLQLHTLQRPNKKIMDRNSLLCGFSIKPGDILE